MTLRSLAAHKLRLALTALAVILGVAFVAGTLVFTDTMGRRFDDLFAKTGQGVAVKVRAKKVIEGADAPAVPASLVGTVARVPGGGAVVWHGERLRGGRRAERRGRGRFGAAAAGHRLESRRPRLPGDGGARAGARR
ncbi:MAG TPA: hypothetical protein VGD53_05835 [Actinoallomurus sp.]